MTRSNSDILGYINDTVENLITKPKSFASCPASLEEMLILLDEMRQFVTEDKRPRSLEFPRSEYYAFLEKRGYGSALVTTQWNVQASFEDVISEWRRYLAEYPSRSGTSG